LEVVTPERMFGIAVGGLNHVPYAKALNEAEARITLHHRLRSVRNEGALLVATIGSDQSSHRFDRIVDQVIVDYGTAANDSLYLELRHLSTNQGAVDYGALMQGRPQRLVRNPTGMFQLFRIGDAVASRNIHAAIYDGLRFAKDL
jgi:N-methyl-L-proline demethylase